MNLYEAAALGRELLRLHGLDAGGWTFGFDHARRRFGRCDYTNRRVTLSRPLALLNGLEEVRDTLLHEVAHALCDPSEGHGRLWRATCRRIGARPMRCYDEGAVVTPPRPPPRYAMGCPACGWWVPRRRCARQRRYACRTCRAKVIFKAATPGLG